MPDLTHKPLFNKKIIKRALKNLQIPGYSSKFQTVQQRIVGLNIEASVTNGFDSSRVVSGVEENVKNIIINPLLDILGFRSDQGDLSYEAWSQDGSIDILLKVDGEQKGLVEVKTWRKDLDRQIRTGRYKNAVDQGLRYAQDKGVDWVIITNGHEFRLYRQKIKNENPREFYELFFLNELSNPDVFKKFYLLFSKEAFKEGLDTLFKRSDLRLKQIDEHIFKTLLDARAKLINDIRQNNDIEDLDKLKEYGQKILDRLVFIRYAEDRGFFNHDTKLLSSDIRTASTSITDTRLIVEVVNNVFRVVDQGNPQKGIIGYNGDLFKRHPCEDLVISDRVLRDVINSLYVDHEGNPLDFSETDADIMGGGCMRNTWDTLYKLKEKRLKKSQTTKHGKSSANTTLQNML